MAPIHRSGDGIRDVRGQISSNPADQNSLVYFDVIARDNVGVTSIGLTVGGTPVVLGANGQDVYTASTLGPLSVVATASDAVGNCPARPTPRPGKPRVGLPH